MLYGVLDSTDGTCLAERSDAIKVGCTSELLSHLNLLGPNLVGGTYLLQQPLDWDDLGNRSLGIRRTRQIARRRTARTPAGTA